VGGESRPGRERANRPSVRPPCIPRVLRVGPHQSVVVYLSAAPGPLRCQKINAPVYQAVVE